MTPGVREPAVFSGVSGDAPPAGHPAGGGGTRFALSVTDGAGWTGVT